MKITSVRIVTGILIAWLWSGCQVGRDSTLFVTKTSFGVDIDGKPPTLGIGYDRKEGTVAPKFADGNVIPQMASFQGRGGGFTTSVIGAAQSFAIGQPAVIMSKYMGSPDSKPSVLTSIPLTELDSVYEVAGNTDTARRYFFGTDTNLGVDIHLAAENGGLPTSLSVGWKRKELAYVPLEMKNPGGATPSVVVPSLISTVNFGVNPQSGTTNLNQFFATGIAANYLSAQPDIRSVLGSRIFADSQVSAKLEARQAAATALATTRTKGEKLTAEAQMVVNALDADPNTADAKINAAHQAAIDAGIMDKNEPFPSTKAKLPDGSLKFPNTTAGKKAYLKVISVADDSDLGPFQDYVTKLKQIQ